MAQAARQRGLARRVIVWARRPETRQALRGQPWCDGVADSPEESVRGSQLVVVAAPVDRIADLVAQVAPYLEPDALVTDVGSVKGDIVRRATAAVVGRGRFVGSHPMAGSEKTGWEHASPTLFLAGNGLRDTTRIAASDPKIWRSIIEQNRDEILRALREFQDELHAFQSSLANKDYIDVVARLERGKAYRDQFRPNR